jgi:hypothetical protein
MAHKRIVLFARHRRAILHVARADLRLQTVINHNIAIRLRSRLLSSYSIETLKMTIKHMKKGIALELKINHKEPRLTPRPFRTARGSAPAIVAIELLEYKLFAAKVAADFAVLPLPGSGKEPCWMS